MRHGQLTTVLRALRGRTVPPAPVRAAPVRADSAPPVPAVPAVPEPPVPAPPDSGRGEPSRVREIPAELLAGLDARRARQVRTPLDVPLGAPVRWGTAVARQVDGTTCGAAVLGLLAAAGDPVLAAWLVTGRLPDGAAHLPPELAGMTLFEPLHPADPDAPAWFRSPDDRRVHAAATGAEATAARWGLLQAALHRRSTERAVAGVLPWPRALGTPPWGAARAARFPGVAYRAVLVDDTRADEVADLLARLDIALDHGVPVPLYSGGDLSGGLAAAVPRHVVLAAGRTADGYRVYEPGTGRVLPLTHTALLAPAGPVPALGHWTHLTGAVLPTRP
jgi:hypothetical protein